MGPRPSMFGDAASTVPSAAITWATASSFTLRSTAGSPPAADWSSRSRTLDRDRSSTLEVRWLSSVVTSRTLPPASTAAHNSVATAVALARSPNPANSAVRHQAVADQPNRLQAGAAER